MKTSLGSSKIIYPLARIPSREENYLWVGPVFSDALVMLSLAENADEAQLKKAKSIGVLNGSPAHKRLKSEGYSNLVSRPKFEQLISMMKEKRLNAWYCFVSEANLFLNEDGVMKDGYKKIMQGKPTKIYIGFSKNLKDEAKKWQTSLNTFKQEPEYGKILDRYHWENDLR